jgi:C4-dicarboxylate-specific signal transduction histidine kinase
MSVCGSPLRPEIRVRCARPRRIEVRTELLEDLPRVLGDRVQLQQVLLNLVMNGIEAMSGVAEERRVLTIGGRRDELSGWPDVLFRSPGK